jgi:hypothetical protein
MTTKLLKEQSVKIANELLEEIMTNDDISATDDHSPTVHDKAWEYLGRLSHSDWCSIVIQYDWGESELMGVIEERVRSMQRAREEGSNKGFSWVVRSVAEHALFMKTMDRLDGITGAGES